MSESPVSLHSRPPRRLLAVLWLLWLCGLGIAGLLAWKTAGSSPDGSVALPGCTATGFDCDAVLTSPYSQVFGVSLSHWALLYYAVMMVLLVVQSVKRDLFSGLLIPAAAAPSLIAAVYLISVMHRNLGAYCTWCLADHAVNVLFWVTATLNARSQWRAGQQQRLAAGEPPLNSRMLHNTLNAAILLAAWAGTVLAFWHEPTDLTVQAATGEPSPLDVMSFDVSSTGVRTVLGDPNSARTVVMFSCPTCSHCRRVHALLEELLATESYRVEMRFAPLNPDCNPVWAGEDVSESHRPACELSRLLLAVAVTDEKQFARYSHWLYSAGPALTADQARQKAEQLVGAENLQNSLASDVVSERLQEDVSLAEEMEITAVPRLFVAAGPLSGTIMYSNLPGALRRGSEVRMKD